MATQHELEYSQSMTRNQAEEIIINFNSIIKKMKNLLYKLNRWFELNLGWLFVNGRNQQWYANY